MTPSRLGFCFLILVAACWSPLVLAQYCSPTELQVDARNCGTCGTDCRSGSSNSHWQCNSGNCAFRGCLPGYYDLDADQSCEYACSFVSAQESCNNADDDCDGLVDEDLVTPGSVEVCGVAPQTNAAECTTAVTRACIAGSWTCTFPAGVCSGASCAATSEVCDTVDNNCNGLLNENVANYGAPCASDDGLPAPGHGLCRTNGTRVCNGPDATVCSAAPASCAALPDGCTEFCDGKDNDCDGSIDEPYTAKGANAAHFVHPAVTRIANALWIYQYEASRPQATIVSQGSGNGYFSSAPAGVTLDMTPSCSEPGRLPWSNVSATEAQQTCAAMGGTLCTRSNYQSACRPNSACNWGYSPRGTAGSACATPYTGTKYCNLAPSHDFGGGGGPAGDQDGLLTTGDPLLQNCWADRSALQGNTASTEKLYDLTGNLRELTRETATVFVLMGGAYDHRAEDGARCSFTDWSSDQSFRLQDTGFRCCFSVNPTQ